MANEGIPGLADTLNALFQLVPPAGAASPSERYSTSRAAREITSAGTPITDVYLGKLRSGAQSNPSFRHLAAIADLFGVPLETFHNRDVAERVLAELEGLRSAQEQQVAGILGRSHQDNLQFGLSQIKAIIEAMESASAVERGHEDKAQKGSDSTNG